MKRITAGDVFYGCLCVMAVIWAVTIGTFVFKGLAWLIEQWQS